MAKVSSSFIRPIHGISQQTPHIRPDGFVEDMLNMFADVNRGLRRRPGSEFLTKFTGVSNKIYKFFEHDDKLKLFVYDKSTGDVSVYTEGDWSNPLTTTASGDIKDYLDTLEDDEDLLLSIYQNNLYIASKKQDLEFTTYANEVTISTQFEIRHGVLGVITLGQPNVLVVQASFLGNDLKEYLLTATGYDPTYDTVDGYDIAQEYIDSIDSELNNMIDNIVHINLTDFKIVFKPDVVFTVSFHASYRMPLTTTLYDTTDDTSAVYNEASLTLTYTFGGSSYPGRYVRINYDVMDIVSGALDDTNITTVTGSIELNSANTNNMTISADILDNWNISRPSNFVIVLTPKRAITKINEVNMDSGATGWSVLVEYSDFANPYISSNVASGEAFIMNIVPMKVFMLDVIDDAFVPDFEFGYHYYTHAVGTSAYAGGMYYDTADQVATYFYDKLDAEIAQIPADATVDAKTKGWITLTQLPVDSSRSTVQVNYWAGYNIRFEATPAYAPAPTITGSGNNVTLNTTTAPLRLILGSSLTLTQLDIHLTDQTADLVFLYSYIQGQPIIDITVYQNRLLLITKSAMLASQIGRFNNFDPEQPDVYSDADPIVLLIASKGDELQAMLPFNDSIVFFGKEQQYTLFVNGIFSLTNLTLLPATSYTISSTKPIRVGSEAYFVTPNNNYSILKKYIVQPNTQIKTAYDITTFVPKFIPANPKTLAYSEPIDLLVVHPAANSNELYVCNQHFSGMQQDQQAWHKWTFAYNIQQVFIDSDGVIYMIHSNGSEYYVVKLNPVNNDTPYYMDYIVAANPPEWVSNLPAGTVVAYVAQSGGDWIDVETEAEADYKGVVYNSYVTFSPWYLKDNKGNPMTAGKLQLKSLEMVFDNTWYFKVTSQSYGRPPVFKDFKNVQLDGVLILGGVEEEGLDSSDTTSGIFKMYIGGQAPNTFIKVSNEVSVWNFGVIGYTLYGNWQGYNQWTTIKR